MDHLTAIADGLGLALGRSALTQESHQSEVVLETACAVARAISGSLDLERTFGQIALSAARVMGNCSCLLLQLEADTGDLVAVSASDREDDTLIGLRIRFHDQDCPAAVLQERRSIMVDDVVFGAGVDDACRERLKIRSALFVPISAEDGLIGSLLLYSTERRARYSPRDIARAETVAEQAAGAICNARLYHDLERSKAEGQALLHRITRLRERQRVDFANVVHDEILQTVVAALYEVEGLRAPMGDEADPDIDRVADLLKSSIAEARRMIFELRPAVLDGLGLAGALTALTERTGGEADAVVNVRIPDAPTLSAGVSTAVYMIAREALQNARRHAAPHRVEITLAATNDETAVLLEVRDDGCGFSPESLDGSEHFGLTMMDEQAALVGGRLRVESSPGVGTRITAVVPLEGSA